MFKDFANMDAPTIHEVSYNVVEVFEDYLESLDVVIPCADADEESERLEDDNAAALYGEEYWRLIDEAENWFCSFPLLAEVYSSKFLAAFDVYGAGNDQERIHGSRPRLDLPYAVRQMVQGRYAECNSRQMEGASQLCLMN